MSLSSPKIWLRRDRYSLQINSSGSLFFFKWITFFQVDHFFSQVVHFWKEIHPSQIVNLKSTLNCPYKVNVYLCILLKWTYKLFLELNVFRQSLQGWMTPAMWFVSMWSLMAFHWPSFPHNMHILAFTVEPLEELMMPLLIIISDWTCPSTSSRVALILLFVRHNWSRKAPIQCALGNAIYGTPSPHRHQHT